MPATNTPSTSTEEAHTVIVIGFDPRDRVQTVPDRIWAVENASGLGHHLNQC